LFYARADFFERALNRHGRRLGQRLHDDIQLHRRLRSRLERVAAVDRADLHRREHERMLVFLLVFLFPVLDRLGDLARLDDEVLGFAVDRDLGPDETGVADLELEAGRLADDAHVGGDSVVHHIARADAGAAIGLAGEAVYLCLLDLADYAGDDDVALELDAGLLQHLDGDNVARKGRLHVDKTAAIDAVALDLGLLRRIEMVHVRVEHERRAAARAFQRADDVRAAFLDLLVLDAHAELFEFATQVMRDVVFLAGDADGVGEIFGDLDEAVLVQLRKYFLHLNSLSCFSFPGFF